MLRKMTLEEMKDQHNELEEKILDELEKKKRYEKLCNCPRNTESVVVATQEKILDTDRRKLHHTCMEICLDCGGFMLMKWLVNIRNDGRIELVCDHGVGHTAWAPSNKRSWYEHGCDGCCSRKDFDVKCREIRRMKREDKRWWPD